MANEKVPPHEKMMPEMEMRGVVIISVPGSDCDGGKTVCAAVWQRAAGPQPQIIAAAPIVERAPEEVQQQEPVVPASAAPSTPLQSERKRRPRKVFRMITFCTFSFVLFCLFAYKVPSLLNLEEQLQTQEDDEEDPVHVYSLYPKYTTIPIQLSQIRGMLLERDMKRLGKVAMSAASGKNHSAVFPARGNIYPDGLYYMALLVGNPPKMYFLDIDTGSDLTWLNCDAPCRSCAKGPHGLYDPKKAKLIDCRLPMCTHVQEGGSYSCIGGVSQCDYDVQYIDGSSTMGVLLEDTITLLLTNGSQSPTKAVIGCGYDQQGSLAQSPASTDGVMGLSSSKVALPSQLAGKGIIQNIIGHCLAGGSNGGGYLFFGNELVPLWGMTWTRIMGRPAMEGYQARLQSIKYGGNSLNITGQEWTGDINRVMFDSGTSFTYLVPPAYAAVLTAVEDQARRSGLVRITSDKVLPYCWRGPSPFQSVTDVNRYFKQVSFDFGGSNWFSTHRTLDLSPEGYLIVSTKGNVCLGILDASGASLEVTNIIGDISMRGYLVIYDNVHQQIGWIRRNCHNRPTRTSTQIASKLPSLFD